MAQGRRPWHRPRTLRRQRVPRFLWTSGSSSELWAAFYGEVQHPEFPVREGDHVEPMDKIRRLTAEHMVVAKRVAPHVHSFIEIDFSQVDHIRVAHKGQWAEQGVRVSFTGLRRVGVLAVAAQVSRDQRHRLGEQHHPSR